MIYFGNNEMWQIKMSNPKVNFGVKRGEHRFLEDRGEISRKMEDLEKKLKSNQCVLDAFRYYTSDEGLDKASSAIINQKSFMRKKFNACKGVESDFYNKFLTEQLDPIYTEVMGKRKYRCKIWSDGDVDINFE